MPFELVIFANGTASVRPKGAHTSNEAMHSSIGPWQEANLLYVNQSKLAQKLTLADPEPLVLFDVGMGLAANALAAIVCAQQVAITQRRPLQIISFEQDLDGLRTALQHLIHFPFFANFEATLVSLLTHRQWSDPTQKLRWELREGDFTQLPLDGPEPEVIFYDFYSPASQDAALWSTQNFERLYQACAKRRASQKETSLYTYSSATAARAAMLLAGFYVGIGDPTSVKRETTVASTQLHTLTQPLDPSWLKKLERTHKPVPTGSDGLHGHPQFSA